MNQTPESGRFGLWPYSPLTNRPMETKVDTPKIEETGILRVLLDANNEGFLEWSDYDEQIEILDKLLDAELKLRALPVELKKAEHAKEIATIDGEVRKAQIAANTEIEIAKIQAGIAVKSAAAVARAPYLWRKYLVRGTAAVAALYVLSPYIARLLEYVK